MKNQATKLENIFTSHVSSKNPAHRMYKNYKSNKQDVKRAQLINDLNWHVTKKAYPKNLQTFGKMLNFTRHQEKPHVTLQQTHRNG